MQVGINYQPPTVVPGGDLSKVQRSLENFSRKGFLVTYIIGIQTNYQGIGEFEQKGCFSEF